MANYDDPKRMRPVDHVEEPFGSKDDPLINRRRDYGERDNAAMWIAGAVALAVVIAVGVYAASTKPTNVTDKPTVSETRSTTGSAATNPTAAPQKQ